MTQQTSVPGLYILVPSAANTAPWAWLEEDLLLHYHRAVQSLQSLLMGTVLLCTSQEASWDAISQHCSFPNVRALVPQSDSNSRRLKLCFVSCPLADQHRFPISFLGIVRAAYTIPSSLLNFYLLFLLIIKLPIREMVLLSLVSRWGTGE